MFRGLLAGLFWLSNPSHAADLYVCAQAGICSKDAECAANPGDCHVDVSGAVSAASGGDIIWLSAETYPDTVANNGGPSPLTIVGDIANGGSTIDGDAGGDVLDFKDVDIILRDLTVMVSEVADRRCIKSDGGTLLLENVTVDRCLKDKGAGLEAKNGSVVTLERSDFTDNEAHGNNKGGGHILISTGAAVSVNDVTFILGQATGAGGIGGGIHNEGGTLSIFDGYFSDNLATGNGGAIHTDLGAATDATRSEFQVNSGVNGGALSANGALTVYKSVFLLNSGTDGGGVFCGLGSACNIEASEFSLNTADRGGGFHADSSTNLQVVGNNFCQNANNAVALGGQGVQGGGGFVDAGSGLIANNIFMENTTSTQGGGVSLTGGAAFEVSNNHFIGNESGDVGGAIYSGAATSNIFNDLFLNNSSPNSEVVIDVLGLATLDFNLWFLNSIGDANVATGGGALFTDPLLLNYVPGDCGTGNLWPGPASPLIDNGDPAFMDPDGTPSDIGAFGGPGADPCLGQDQDDDEVCDQDDVCNGFDDAIDTDFDGNPDGCDPCPTDDPDDSDGDGVCEGVDICPGFDDADDADSDGTPDGCDPCPDDAYEVDGDGDGWLNCVDCNDSDPAVNPAVVEVPGNGIDDDCDGFIDYGPDTGDTGTAGDADTDTDADSDTDTDVDADSDADADIDTDVDTDGREFEPGGDTSVSGPVSSAGCDCSSAPTPLALWMMPLLVVLTRRQKE